MGHVIPAGTGFSMYRNAKLVPLAEPIAAEELIGDQVPGAIPDAEPAAEPEVYLPEPEVVSAVPEE